MRATPLALSKAPRPLATESRWAPMTMRLGLVPALTATMFCELVALPPESNEKTCVLGW